LSESTLWWTERPVQPLTKEFFARLPSAHLEHITIHNQGLGDRDLKRVLHAVGDLRNIQHLVLSGNALTDASVTVLTNVVRAARHLSHLDLSDNRLTCEGLRQLAVALTEHETIRYLGLACNLVRERGVTALAWCMSTTRVSTVNLGGNVIGDGGVAALAKVLGLSQTKRLGLSSTGMTCLGVRSIATALVRPNSVLSVLCLSGNRVGDTGLMLLLAALKDRDTMRELDLESSLCGPYCGRIIADWLKSSTLCLTDLQLTGNELTASDTAYILSSLLKTRISTLSLSTDHHSPQVAAHLKSIPVALGVEGRVEVQNSQSPVGLWRW